jgi:hypothetical protein
MHCAHCTNTTVSWSFLQSLLRHHDLTLLLRRSLPLRLSTLPLLPRLSPLPAAAAHSLPIPCLTHILCLPCHCTRQLVGGLGGASRPLLLQCIARHYGTALRVADPTDAHNIVEHILWIRGRLRGSGGL